MFRALANFFNESANSATDRELDRTSVVLYRLAICVKPRWSAPWYNLGLQMKHDGDWLRSLRYSQRAVMLDPDDEASWWNLGIAATALHDWQEARRAWSKFGVSLQDLNGEVRMPEATACVRIDPQGCGEVVWGTRIDPARIVVRSVPLPKSRRRYQDVLLNDGARDGSRSSDGQEYPVLNELGLWKASPYSTFQVTATVPDVEAQESLVELCEESDIGLEDWSGVRILCRQCSVRNLCQQGCVIAEEEPRIQKYGFGAQSRAALIDTLECWKRSARGTSFENPRLVLMAPSQE
jgi:tetratricopeptide (TPR) repeat protein